MSKHMDAKEAMLRKLGIKTYTEEPQDEDKFQLVPNRIDLRHAGKRSKIKGVGKVHDLLRIGLGKMPRRTGQPLWFRRMQYEETRKKLLVKVRTHELSSAVGPVADKLFNAGYGNVWALTQETDINKFLVHGVRTKELKHLREYLVKQNVPVAWEV